MAFYAQYPPSGSNPSIGPGGQPAPSFATEVAGVDQNGDLRPISTDVAGNQNVNVVDSVLPTGAATEAKQDAEIAVVQAFSDKTAAALVPEAFDNMAITYVPSGNGVGEIQTVTYKLAATTVAVLTLVYDGNNNLTAVVKS